MCESALEMKGYAVDLGEPFGQGAHEHENGCYLWMRQLFCMGRYDKYGLMHNSLLSERFRFRNEAWIRNGLR